MSCFFFLQVCGCKQSSHLSYKPCTMSKTASDKTIRYLILDVVELTKEIFKEQWRTSASLFH